MAVFKRKGQKYFKAEIWIDGTRHGITTTCTTKREAAKEVDRLEDELRKRLATEAKASTSLAIGDVRDLYVKLVASAHKDTYKTILECNRITGTADGSITGFFPRSKLFTEINHHDALALREWRAVQTYGKAKKQVGPYSINDTVEQLKKFATFLKQRKVELPNEPTWPTLWVSEPVSHIRELGDDEARRLDAAIDKLRPDLRPLCDYAEIVAHRKTESFTLLWDNVKWARGVIETIGKGGKLHVTKIDDAVRDILWPLWVDPDRHPTHVFYRVAQRTFDKVIRGKRQCEVKGTRHAWNKDSLRRVWDTVRDEAGLRYGVDRFRWHDYRHSYASKAIRMGQGSAGLSVASEGLGHARKGFTLQVYGHLLEGAVSDTRQQLAEQRKQRRSGVTTSDSVADVIDNNADANHVTDHVLQKQNSK